MNVIRLRVVAPSVRHLNVSALDASHLTTAVRDVQVPVDGHTDGHVDGAGDNVIKLFFPSLRVAVITRRPTTRRQDNLSTTTTRRQG